MITSDIVDIEGNGDLIGVIYADDSIRLGDLSAKRASGSNLGMPTMPPPLQNAGIISLAFG
jgi:hypothetical protein